MPDYESYFAAFLERQKDCRRSLKNYNFSSHPKLINFSSNDYLGLSRHPLLIERSQDYTRRFGASSGASRLITGNLPVYTDLEDNLAKALNKPAALIVNSGYQTNFSVLEALLDSSNFEEDPIIFCDKFCHNSMLINIRYRNRLVRFKHNDLTHLENLLDKNRLKKFKFILVESLYSMDGDYTDLKALTSLAKKYDAYVYVDDAHAVGICGAEGWGKTGEYSQDIDMIMGTFSKGLGSYGGYIGCSAIMRDFLINRCKGMIYSTGLPPSVLGAISAAIELIPHLHEERQRLRNYSSIVRDFFKKAGLNDGNSESHIIPWIIGDSEKAMRASLYLEEKGIIAVCIRPPTVPKGTSRIRFCLSSIHTEADIEYLMDTILTVEQRL